METAKQFEIVIVKYYDSNNVLVGLCSDDYTDGKRDLYYTHHCSNTGFALGDLIKNQPDRISELKEKFGDFEVTGEGVQGVWKP